MHGLLTQAYAPKLKAVVSFGNQIPWGSISLFVLRIPDEHVWCPRPADINKQVVNKVAVNLQLEAVRTYVGFHQLGHLMIMMNQLGHVMINWVT